jgi:hypothetical protein
MDKDQLDIFRVSINKIKFSHVFIVTGGDE